MRTALFAVAAVAAAGLVVPVTMAAAGAADPTPSGGITYRDPAQTSAASVSVTGTLTSIDGELGGDHGYAVSLPGGGLVPVSLDAHDGSQIAGARPFTGDIAIPDALASDLAARGVTVDDGEDVSGRTAEGKAVLAAAGTSTEALPVQSATIGSEPTRNSTTARSTTASSTHRLYVAAITNLGTLDSDATISSDLSQMRTYWQTESDGLISGFTQPSAMVKYASTQATSSNSCGMDNSTAVWNEAATKFPDVNFSTAGNHLMVLIPQACGAKGTAGIGTVGGSLGSGGSTIVTLGDTAVEIGVHELGHNLSLEHANAETCPSSCTTNEYWDLYSIMGLAVSGGSWTPAALDTSYRLLLGIDDANSVPTVTTTSTVHLAGRATTSGTRGFVVTDPASGTKYAVDYRSGTGRDKTAFYAGSSTINHYVFRPGVVVERMESKDDTTTMITRPSGGEYLTSFVAGETFTRGSLTIKVTAAGSAGADVDVTLPSAASPSTFTPPSPAPSTTPPVTPSTTPSSTPPPTPKTFSPGTPVISGTARVGQRLSVATTPWSPTPQRYSVRWLADGKALAGATRTWIVVSRAELGKRISVVVTGSRDGYTSVSRTSAATRPVAAGRFSSRNVHIAGRAQVGRTLSATTSGWQPAPSFSYRWYANGRPIAKATGRTLQVTKSLRGKRITVRITARQAGYESASRTTRTGRVR